MPEFSSTAGSARSGADPLFDTLFRPTGLTPSIASAAPVRAVGTRSRAGNAMGRTRAALLDGARRAVALNGTKITMAQVAAAAGVAKATLYNHFRTREAVLSALLVDEVQALAASLRGLPLDTALVAAADALSRHPVLRALARTEPATLAALGSIDASAEGWSFARADIAAALAEAGRSGADSVVRWLASYVVSPGDSESIAAEAAVIMAGLPAALAECAPAFDEPASRPA